MKILSLKYKLHKLVNLVFYLIVFGLGFLLGFLGNKINFDDLLGNFLFIDKVYAEEITCTESENLFNVNDLVVGDTENSPGIEIRDNEFYIYSGKGLRYYKYIYTFESGINYKVSIDSINGDSSTIETRYLGGSQAFWLYVNESKTLNYEEETTLEFRFYNNQSYSAGNSTFTNFKIIKEICGNNENNDNEEDKVVDIVNDNFYNFSKKIIGDLGEENYFVYDFITLGLVSICFIFFVLLVGYIIKKFFGG